MTNPKKVLVNPSGQRGLTTVKAIPFTRESTAGMTVVKKLILFIVYGYINIRFMEVGAEAPQSEVIRTNDELCRFLLPDSLNARKLSGSDLGWEVGIVGVKANRHPESWLQAMLREQVEAKAQQDAEKYHLNDTDRDALKQLYTGFAQSMLYRDGQEFASRIEAGETTEWLADEEYPPDNLRVKGMEYISFRNPESFELAHLNARGKESEMARQEALRTLRASPDLLKAVVGEFNRVAVVDGENRQLRKSSEGLFRFTALQAPATFPAQGDTGRRAEVFAVPIHRVAQFKGV